MKKQQHKPWAWTRVLDRQAHPRPEAGGGFRKEVLKRLSASGSDTNRPHTFEFFLYLPTEAAAETAAQRLRESDFQRKCLPLARAMAGFARLKLRSFQ